MNRIRTLLSAILLAGTTGFAGTFTADFATDDTSQFILNGAAYSPFIATNRLILTPNEININTSFSPNDFDAGAEIEAFKATFKLQFGPGTSTPADGAAFCFGPGVDQYSTYSEVGSGGQSLAVSFHTYTSRNGPAVDVYLYGNELAHFPMPVGDMVNAQLQDVTIELKRDATLAVSYRGQVVCTNLYLPGWGHTAGFFLVCARTGGASEETDLDDVNINTTLFTASVAPTVTADPQSVAVAEGASATFNVGFSGSGPFAIQWLKNGNEIQDATNKSLTLLAVPYSDNNAKISARIGNDASTITSAQATLTVTRDTIAPTVVKTAGDNTFTAVTLTFSEPVTDTALSTSRYSFDQGVSVTSVDRISPTTVRLTTSQMAQDKIFTITINGVQDSATTPNTIAANTKVTLRTFVFLTGSLLHSKYLGFPDNSRAPALFADPRFGIAPDRRDLMTMWEYPSSTFGGRDPVADPARNYADTIEGYFIPPTTTNYVFFTSGADYFSLYLSTDEDPANKNLVTEIGGWTNPRGWNAGQGGTDMTNARSDTSGVTAWPFGNTISLIAGQRYYMLLVHTDPSWAGGDQFGATFKIEGEADPVAGDAPKLTGNLVGYFIDPAGATITFNEQPQSATVQEGGSVTFSASVTAVSAYGTNAAYQWQSAPQGSTTFTNIPGAIKATYSTPPLTKAGFDGLQFRLLVNVPPITDYSAVATLTVNANTTPPVPTVGAMLDATAGTVDVGVGFDKPMDDASASLLSNYTISSGTIVSLTWNSNRFTANSQNPLVMVRKQTALLKVTGFSGTTGTLTIKNVVDSYGNKLTSATVPFTVDTKMKWDVVGANQSGGWNAVVPVAANGFDIYSDGVSEWGNYDESTFVYEQVTGDFDKKLRVEYQDGSSQWARAGLVVRDVPNFGVDAATQQGSQPGNTPTFPYDGKAGRYQKIHVNPVGATLTGPGSAGNASWEGNRRLDTGGGCTSLINGPNSVPLYPNAWCRIQRVGQKFTYFRSDDGVNWITLGATTWGADDQSKTPMPATVYVGPEYSPETGNITTPDQGTFLAQIRDYGDFVSVFNPQLKIGSDATGKVTITWAGGTLYSSSTINGTYAPVQAATSPLIVTPAPGTIFYRVKQ